MEKNDRYPLFSHQLACIYEIKIKRVISSLFAYNDHILYVKLCKTENFK